MVDVHLDNVDTSLVTRILRLGGGGGAFYKFIKYRTILYKYFTPAISIIIHTKKGAVLSYIIIIYRTP